MEDMHIHLKKGVTDISIMREYIEKCKKCNIKRVLFLDHGNRESKKHIPVLNDYNVVKQFLENIKTVREEYPEIEINAGIESDFSYDEEFAKKELDLINNFEFDLVIGSVHGMGNADYKDYLQANIDMLNTYPINILGHLKLRKEYEEYKELIEQIVKLAAKKGVKFDLNTSERSRWNLGQLEYMLKLFDIYGAKYTIGSDAHCVEEIAYGIEETYIKLDKIKNNAKRDIEYTIVSRGTEKYGSKGYMGITTINKEKRLLVLAKHFDKYIDTYKDSFEISSKYSIENIAVSRFELMSALAINPVINLIKDNILIVGFGNIGFTTLLYLLKKGYKNISILTRNIKEFQIKAVERLKVKYNANIKFVEEYKNYNCYIEATGSSEVIKNIVENAEYSSTIIFLGTPRDDEYLISPLDINRRNLRIIGGHELNGHTREERDVLFKELLKENDIDDLKQYVNIYMSNANIVNKILENKENFIEVIKYDI